MLKAVVFIVMVAAIVILVNSSAEYRAENDLVLRLCNNQVQVIGGLRRLMLSKPKQGEAVMKETHPSMIAAKLLFILPQRGDESVKEYLFRAQDFLSQRCSQ